MRFGTPRRSIGTHVHRASVVTGRPFTSAITPKAAYKRLAAEQSGKDLIFVMREDLSAGVAHTPFAKCALTVPRVEKKKTNGRAS
jgi:hypothetical protein